MYSMKKTAIGIISICFITLLVVMPMTFSENTNTTTLEIVSVEGSIAAVKTSIQNTGEESAEEVAITVHVSGGLANSIDLTHICSGCSVCGTSLAAGAIKTENTAEAGIIFGLGPITIDVTAVALNADEVSGTYSAYIIGPLVLFS